MVLQEPFGQKEGVAPGKPVQAENVQAEIVRGTICPRGETIYTKGPVRKCILLLGSQDKPMEWELSPSQGADPQPTGQGGRVPTQGK